MKTKVLLVTMVAIVAMVASVGAWAHEEGSDSCQGEGSTYAKHARMPMLTSEQREEVKAKVAEMHEQSATREEVREAVGDMLKGWGIEAPRRGVGPRSGQPGQPPRWGQQGPAPQWGQRGMGIMQQLTPEQCEQVKATISEMKEQSASREEIREAVRQLLEE